MTPGVEEWPDAPAVQRWAERLSAGPPLLLHADGPVAAALTESGGGELFGMVWAGETVGAVDVAEPVGLFGLGEALFAAGRLPGTADGVRVGERDGRAANGVWLCPVTLDDLRLRLEVQFLRGGAVVGTEELPPLA